MKKIIKIFLVIIILFIIFLYVYLTPKNYNLEYNIQNINIEEEYDKEDKYYEITFEYNNFEYKYLSFDKYNKRRKIIENIDVYEYKEYTCLVAESDVIKLYPLCKKNDLNIGYHLVEELKDDISSDYYKEVENKADEYKNIKISYLDDKTYLIWNYNGFDIINKDSYKSILLFDNDVYDISLAFLLNNNLVIPDYQEDYRFDKLYIYNIDKEKLDIWNIKNPIYFDTYLLGFYDKSAFMFDRKQNKEFELVPHKQKIRTISPKILDEDEWEKVSSKKLNSQKLKFEYDEIVSYEIKNNKLYKIIDDYEVLISNQKVKDIVYYDNNVVYYLVEDILYRYSLEYGEVKIMSDFEWNFNYENMIFVY